MRMVAAGPSGRSVRPSLGDRPSPRLSRLASGIAVVPKSISFRPKPVIRAVEELTMRALRSLRGPRVLLMACCALASGCGGPTDPSPSTLEGQWSGTTSQGTPISFTVSSDQKVTAITVGYTFNGCAGTQTFANLSLE